MKKQAFTLAEVLITLGIIGVVAAMTMPTLINQTRGAQYKTAFKKALSSISQAVTLNVALDDISFADSIKGKAGEATKANDSDDGMTVAGILQARMNGTVTGTSGLQYTFPADLGKIKTCATGTHFNAAGTKCINDTNGSESNPTETDDIASLDTFFMLNDGIIFGYRADDAYACTNASLESGAARDKYCYGIIDVNGAKGPNRVVACDSGTTGACTVSNPTDIYPVVFYDQTILPASDAANAVMYGK